MTPAQKAALEAALKLPYPTFPCRENKTPACPKGFHAARTAATGLAELWARYPGELVGIPTGDASGLAVLDIDKKSGGLDWWNANRGRLPATRLHLTRSGGIHAVFKHRPGLKCSTSKIAPGVDVRAEGGYFIFWAATGLKVRNTPLADWPKWLVPAEPKRATEYVKALIRPSAVYAPDIEARLKGIAQCVERAAEGNRNSMTYWASRRVRELIDSGAISPTTGRDLIIAAAVRSGLPHSEARQTFGSAMRGRA